VRKITEFPQGTHAVVVVVVVVVVVDIEAAAGETPNDRASICTNILLLHQK
jgi:hypothetical protein